MLSQNYVGTKLQVHTCGIIGSKTAVVTKGMWVHTPRNLHTDGLYTLAAPGPVRKASVMGPRRVVTRRPQTGRLHRELVKAGRDEDLGQA
jgi:hypothetical protein